MMGVWSLSSSNFFGVVSLGRRHDIDQSDAPKLTSTWVPKKVEVLVEAVAAGNGLKVIAEVLESQPVDQEIHCEVSDKQLAKEVV